ncbi:hypothetical protein HZP84_10165 [Elizabethkingia anophelis]|uniref:Uncharacterized protein n=1 Tax=Elizabethkingia anophelis TaxID=1117645 RepID=A0A7Z7LY80_9FLAO|nr:hypothetical protein [Elizabethkingia anophelis]MCT3629346.1 hypothetical protein [Elizabethkingia anophelis]MCT3632807.1 hypothetical protein [Elizabethkingia anophelis]MCT3691812.1 hypothetical protein [Elizabethkingia anophelis]MCT3823278.1 hypothetical protein [Elizabethkingia anophelis]MCT3829590.1 hypothetical protein [Elizabethkingia anophelis]
MDELELLKKDWNKDSGDFKIYSAKEIFGMLKRKSISFSTSLLLLGITEIALWLVFDVIYGLGYRLVRYTLFFCFTGLLWYTFYRIKNTINSKDLMKSILMLRRIVVIYVIAVFSTLIIECILNFDIMTNQFYTGWQEGRHGKYQVGNLLQPTLKIYILFSVILLSILLFISLIYKNFYGNILHKLRANYKELTKLEESNA